MILINKQVHTKKVFLITWSLLCSSLLYGQDLFNGSITDSEGYPISYAQVCVKSKTVCSYSDAEGNFKIQAQNSDTIIIKFLGYNTLVSAIAKGKTFKLEEEILELDEILIDNKSESELKSEEPITTTVLDAKEVRKQAITTASLLKRSTGVLVREQGGLGSKTTINLNGLTGNAVRMYYDGIPIGLLGGALSLNNISINLIDRIEIYKGVLPISIGTDALGGGINIVPLKIDFDFAEASYEIGSFNTHKLSMIGAKVLKKGAYVTGNLAYNHSDNDYLMKNIPNQTEEIIESIFGGTDTIVVQNIVDAKRFHNKHDSFYGSVELGVNNKKYADELSFRSSYSYVYNELQHGQTVTKQAVGEANELVN